jgi:hypothetical protein
MPTISKYVEVSEDQLRMIAGHIEAWIEKTGATHEEFAQKYNRLKDQRCPAGTVAPMDRHRVLSYLNLAKGKTTSTHLARVPRCREIELVAVLIGIPVEQLVGQETESVRHMLKVADSTAEAAEFQRLMSSRQAETADLIGLAEFLPCSLETPEFMHAHHNAIFRNIPGDVQVWDGIGNARRNEFLTEGRTWRFTQLNFLSDLKDIAFGGGHYKAVPPQMRKSCLKNLTRLLTTQNLNVRMLIADDENDDAVRALRADISPYDSVVTWDEHLGIVRDRFGIAHYSYRKRYTKYWRGLQEEFIEMANFSDVDSVVGVLKDLCSKIVGEDQGITTVASPTNKTGANTWARQR